MAEKSEFFSSFIDIEKRMSFSLNQEISPDNFKELVGQYKLDEEVACQVRAKGGICHQKHKNGWLGVTKDGNEALIGGHCARNYFKADKNFAIERKRVCREINRKRNIDKIKEYKVDSLTYMEYLLNLRKEIISTREIYDDINKNFPSSVLSFIDNSRKTKKWDIKIDILKTNNKGNKNWVSGSLGTLKPLPYKYEIINLISKIKLIIETYNEICQIDPETLSTPKSKKLIDIISEKDGIKNKIIELRDQINNFIKIPNLESLIYTCNDNDDEYLLAKAIMILTNSKVLTDGHINLRVRRIKERIEKQFGGYQIRRNQLIDKFSTRNVFSI